MKTARSEERAVLKREELEAAPGAPLAPVGCGLLAQEPAQGGGCGASGAPGERSFAERHFLGPRRGELHAALNKQEATGRGAIAFGGPSVKLAWWRATWSSSWPFHVA